MIERFFSRKVAVCLISAIFINSASFSQNPRHPKAVMSGPMDTPVASHEGVIGLINGSPGMRIVYVPQISDTFSQAGRLEVDVKVNRKGDVIDASYDVSGSETADGALVKLALATAYRVKFSPGDSTRSGTMVMYFRVYDSADSQHDRVDTISKVAGTRMAIVPTLSDDSIENASVAVDVTVTKWVK